MCKVEIMRTDLSNLRQSGLGTRAVIDLEGEVVEGLYRERLKNREMPRLRTHEKVRGTFARERADERRRIGPKGAQNLSQATTPKTMRLWGPRLFYFKTYPKLESITSFVYATPHENGSGRHVGRS
jgi:hypothetical protein